MAAAAAGSPDRPTLSAIIQRTFPYKKQGHHPLRALRPARRQAAQRRLRQCVLLHLMPCVMHRLRPSTPTRLTHDRSINPRPSCITPTNAAGGRDVRRVQQQGSQQAKRSAMQQVRRTRFLCVGGWASVCLYTFIPPYHYHPPIHPPTQPFPNHKTTGLPPGRQHQAGRQGRGGHAAAAARGRGPGRRPRRWDKRPGGPGCGGARGAGRARGAGGG